MTKARDTANLVATGVPNSLITLDAAEIPNISTDKLTSGTLHDARIADLSATKLTGSIADARLPSTALNSNVDLTNLSASNLTSGTIPTARISALPSGIGGKILQYAVDNDGNYMNLASVTSWENTDLSITFTPISSSSTIVVKGFINVYTGGNSGSYHGHTQYKLQKDNSDFGETYNNYSGYTSHAALFVGPLPFNVQESAGSTSARTYKVQIRNTATQTYSAHNQYSGKSVLEVYEI